MFCFADFWDRRLPPDHLVLPIYCKCYIPPRLSFRFYRTDGTRGRPSSSEVCTLIAPPPKCSTDVLGGNYLNFFFKELADEDWRSSALNSFLAWLHTFG